MPACYKYFMNYSIIEDASPYYIRFSFDGLQDIVNFAKSRQGNFYNCIPRPGYTHENYSIEDGNKIISMLPMSSAVAFKNHRVAVFNTPPGGGCGPHKDGVDHRISFNIPIEISDDECQTYWYNDEDFANLAHQGDVNYGRIVWPNWKDLDQFVPVKTMRAKPGEMILFNTDIYHAWTNQNSKNHRKILTLRTVTTSLYFETIRKIIFKF